MKMTRGDSSKWVFQRRDADGNIITAAPHAIFWTVKRSFDGESYVLQKRLGDGIEFEDSVFSLSIAPEDTESLEYGNYVFDIEVIQDAGGSYKKTIKKGQFILTGESTWAVNEEGESE